MSNQNLHIKMPAQVATGMYQVGIVDGQTKEVKYMSPWRRNLILNSGLRAVADRPWMECIRYCFAAGGSTTPNYLDSGTTVAVSNSAGAVTVSGGAVDLTAVAAGDSILWDTGEQGLIQSISSTAACVISTEYANPSGIPSGEFTFIYTSRSKLTGTIPGGAVLLTSAGVASSYLAGAPNQQVSFVHSANDSIVTNRQTYDFPSVTNPAGETYNEIGISWATVSAPGPWAPGASQPTLFSRIVLDAPLALAPGDYLRVVYQLTITISPTSATATSMSIDNSGTPETWTGSSKLYNLGLGIISVGETSIGSSSYVEYDSYSNEPSVVGGSPNSYLIWVSYTQGAHNGVFPNYGAGTYWTDYISPTLVTTALRNLYASGLTYSQEKHGTWTIGQATANSIKAMGFGKYNPTGTPKQPYVYAGIINIFDASHTKLNTQTLTLKIKYSWSRTLTID